MKRQIVSYLVDLLEDACQTKGFEFPITVVMVAVDGSTLVARWKILENGDPDVDTRFYDVKGVMLGPINVLLVDAQGKGARALIEKGQSVATLIKTARAKHVRSPARPRP